MKILIMTISSVACFAGYVVLFGMGIGTRLASRRLISPSLPKVVVIIFNELIPNIEIESIKTVRMPDEN